MKPKLRQTLLFLFVLSAFSSAHAGANTCADSEWADTLRCKAHPNDLPQPLPPPLVVPAAIKDFMRVNMAPDLSVRCVDGTQPIIYVDPAVGGASSKWLISLTGGGSCAAQDLDQNSSFESGQACAALYADASEADEMGTARKPWMKNLGGAVSEGILKPNLARNPVFARYNRVRIEKCSYDRYNGSATHTGLAAIGPGAVPFSYTLFNHGQKIVLLTLDVLRGQGAAGNGLAYSEFVPDGIGGVTSVTVTLPSIENATQILFVGHSGAGHGLYHNVDRINAYVHAWPGFHGDFRVLHDAQFPAAAENEAAFDMDAPSGLFSQDYSGTSAELGAYDASAYFQNSKYTQDYAAWMASPTGSLDTIFDASCVAAHSGTGDTWKCRDRFHVRFHHETTPAFVREDFSDPNSEHTNSGSGHPVLWGPYGNYAHCTQLGIAPCPPLLPVGANSPYRLRLSTQAANFMAGYPAQSELALGLDTSGPPPSAYLWMPNCGTHESAYDDVQFLESRLIAGAQMSTMRELLEDFVSAPAIGVKLSRVDGAMGYLSECGPRMLATGFE